MRTLLVEDDPVQRAALEDALRRLDLDVTAVPDANAGLVAHLRQPYELLVIDMVLPGMDGIKLCQKVRSIRGGDHPYILMITGRGSTRDLTAVLDAGAGKALEKAIKPSAQTPYALRDPELKRVPKGFEADHPRADLLRHQSLVVGGEQKVPKDIYAGDAVGFVIGEFKKLRPVQKWLVDYVL